MGSEENHKPDNLAAAASIAKKITSTQSTDLITPLELGKIYKVSSQQILDWYHTRIIPADLAEGRVYRFNPLRVSKILSRRARLHARALVKKTM